MWKWLDSGSDIEHEEYEYDGKARLWDFRFVWLKLHLSARFGNKCLRVKDAANNNVYVLYDTFNRQTITNLFAMDKNVHQNKYVYLAEIGEWWENGMVRKLLSA